MVSLKLAEATLVAEREYSEAQRAVLRADILFRLHLESAFGNVAALLLSQLEEVRSDRNSPFARVEFPRLMASQQQISEDLRVALITYLRDFEDTGEVLKTKHAKYMDVLRDELDVEVLETLHAANK